MLAVATCVPEIGSEQLLEAHFQLLLQQHERLRQHCDSANCRVMEETHPIHVLFFSEVTQILEDREKHLAVEPVREAAGLASRWRRLIC